MASTPPLQIVGSPRTPSTPLHGAAYDHEGSPRRSSARLRQKRTFENTVTEASNEHPLSARTPKSTRTSSFELQSPNRTPQRKSTTRRVQIMSPSSPQSDTSAPKPTNSDFYNSQPFLSTTTTLNEGMLPTPVKTPNKKQKVINKSNIAARALFQDQLATDIMAPSPRQNRKNKRFNGFSLESFNAVDGQSRGGVQIFTDSRDQVPEIVKDSDNPFVDDGIGGASSKRVTGNAKRRKVSEPKNMDPQVEEALRNDEGMVYVFRGKKVYRRFDDTGEEEEEIDADDLGLLEYIKEGKSVVKPLKTLTRKSIKPTRLFQTEEQKRARELEKEEEATTDVDETTQQPSSKKRLFHEDSDEADHTTESIKGKGKARKLDSKAAVVDSKINGKANGKSNGKKASPFDSWSRVKPGSASFASASKPSRGRKRAASESLGELSATLT